jgi:hypothetical protein
METGGINILERSRRRLLLSGKQATRKLGDDTLDRQATRTRLAMLLHVLGLSRCLLLLLRLGRRLLLLRLLSQRCVHALLCRRVGRRYDRLLLVTDDARTRGAAM